MDTKWNGTNHDPGVDLEYYVASQIQEAVEGVEEAPGVVRVKPQKHPRLRAWTGLVALLVGFALVVGSLGTALGRWITHDDEDFWKSDWQDTAAFRQAISDYVRDFLTLGAGGELDWYNTVLEGTVLQTDGGWWGELSISEPAVEETVDAAPDAGYQWDKNVLYQILQNGKPLYTNTDQALAYVQGLPEGYNFLLIFKDGTFPSVRFPVARMV